MRNIQRQKFLIIVLSVAFAAVCLLAGCNSDIQVIFDPNYEGATPIAQKLEGGTIVLPQDISRAGYILEGWYVDSNCTQKLDQNAKPADGDVFFAKWIALPQSLSATLDDAIFVGSQITKDMLTVVVTYADDSQRVLLPSEFSVDLQDVTTTAGSKTVTVSYTNNGTTVVAVLSVDVTSVEMQSLTAQYVGDKVFVGGSISKEDFAVTAHYNNGTSAALTAFDISNFSSATAGEKAVKISATENSGISATVIVTVAEPQITSISAEYSGSVFVGGTLNSENLVVTACYEDGTTKPITQYTVGEFSSASAGTQTVTVSVGEISATFTVLVVAPQITSISAEYSGSVFVGGALNSENLVVTAHYEDGSTQPLTQYTVGEFSSEAAGTQTVNLSAGDFSTTFTVSVVAPQITSISAEYSGSVFVGGILNPNNLVVTACYEDGTTKPLTQYTVGAFSSEAAGMQTVTVSVGKVSATFDVRVVVPKVTSISAQYDGDVLVGNSLDMSKLAVCVLYEDGSQKPTTNYILSTFSSAIVGTKTITVTYGGNASLKTTVAVVVRNPLPISLSAEYNGEVAVGGTLDESKITAEALYEDGNTVPVTQFTSSDFSATKEGKTTFTVSCTLDGVSLSTQCSVTVRLSKLMGIVAEYHGGSLFVGDALDLSQITVTAQYDLIDAHAVTDFWTEGFSSREAGEKRVKVCYNENDITQFDYITVEVEKVVLTFITAMPKRDITLYVGDSLDHSLVVVTAIYNNGTIKNIKVFADELDTTEAGQQTATISYTEDDITKTAQVNVTVVAVQLVSIAVSVKSDIELFIGEALDHALLTVTATYNNGAQKPVDNFTDDLHSFEAGNKTVTIAYTEDDITKTATIPVNVLAVELKSIGITKNEQVSLLDGRDFNHEYITVTSTYTNGQQKTLDNYDVSGFDISTAGEITLTVSCGEVSTKITVTVPVLCLAISAEYIGEDIPTGSDISLLDISVTAHYNDGTTAPVALFTHNFNTDILGEQSVTITCEQGGLTNTANISVTVVAVQLVSISVVAQQSMELFIGEALNRALLTVTAHYNNGTQTEIFDYEDDLGSTHAGLQTVTISYTENDITQTDTLSVRVLAIDLQSISIKKNLTVPILNGLEFNHEWLTVTGTYTNGQQKTLENYEISGFDISVAGDVVLTVSCGEVSAKVSVNIPIVCLSISAQYIGNSVPVGMEISAADFVVIAHYNDGSDVEVDQFTLDDVFADCEGEKDVQISALGRTTTAKVQICKAVVVNLAAVQGEKEIFADAVEFVPEMLVVTAHYSDGSAQIVTNYAVSDFAIDGVLVTLTVSYEGGIAHPILIATAVKLTSLSASTNGKIELYFGETLDHSLLTVTAHYNSGAQKEVENYTDDSSLQQLGEQTVTVSYTEGDVTKTATVDVTVLAVYLQSINVQNNAGVSVVEGMEFNRECITVIGTYTNGQKKTLDNYDVSGFDISTAGEITLTVSCDEVSAKTTVTVPVLCLGISAQYMGGPVPIGGSISETDFAVTARYNNGTTSTVAEFSLGSFVADAVGEKQVEVSALGYTVSVEVEVCKSALTNLTASQTKYPVYADDTEFASEMLVVTAHYSDGTSQTISNYTVVEFSPAKASVTVHFGGKEATVALQVTSVTLADISVIYNGAQYLLLGEELQKDDITVTATFSSGKTSRISDFVLSGFNKDIAAEQTVQVSYTLGATKVATFTVTVYAPLVSIAAQYNGANILVGGNLNNSDISVTATYADGQSKPVTNFAAGDFSSALAGTVVVNISYSEQNPVTSAYDTKITTVNIIVTDPAVISNSNLSIHFLQLGRMKTVGGTAILGSIKTGDCVYIKAGDVDILIDAGAENKSAPVLLEYIDQFVTDNKLEYVIATHAHEDHIGAFYSSGSGSNKREGVFEHYKTGTIIEFAQTSKTAAQQASENTVIGKYMSARNGEVAEGAVCYTAAQCFNETDGAQRIYQITEDITLEILYNYYYFNKLPSGDENNASVCIMINQGDNHYMFTGDLENGDTGTASSGAEQKMVDYYNQIGQPLPHCVLYKAGHHGSKTSTSSALMAAITPEYCCICTCCGSSEYTTVNANQFPTQLFVDRIAPYTDRVYITSLVEQYTAGIILPMNGNIVVSCINGIVSVNCSNNNTKLKDSDWFKANRTCPIYWQTGTSTPSMYHD